LSAFVWIDHSEKKRRQVLEAIDQFREKDTRDELGIASIRDAISDALFPGTGALQTRARYFLFVPWMFQQFEAKRVPASELSRRAREFEIRLIDILAETDDRAGTIGIQTRKALQRFPSSIYWNGLKMLRIYQAEGSLGDYYRYAERARTQGAAALVEGEDEPVPGRRRLWHAKLPPAPASFPDGATFALTPDEADYLQERVLVNHPDSLFAFFLREGIDDSDVAFAWDHPVIERTSGPLRRHVELCRTFSEVMHGAPILYNLALAELEPRRPDVIENCEAMLEDWKEQLDARQRDLEHFDSDEFWRMVREFGATPSVPTRIFVDSWYTLVAQPAGRVGLNRSQPAKAMILARERQVKGPMARCENRRVREMWRGEAGLGQLGYRWGSAQTFINDVARAEEGTARA